jgi:hypothetical protein
MAKTPVFQAVMGKKLIVLPLYASEQEIARIVLGERHEAWSTLAGQLEREGLPRRSQLVSGLRYVPKVLHFFDRRELGSTYEDYTEDGPERWDP